MNDEELWPEELAEAYRQSLAPIFERFTGAIAVGPVVQDGDDWLLYLALTGPAVLPIHLSRVRASEPDELPPTTFRLRADRRHSKGEALFARAAIIEAFCLMGHPIGDIPDVSEKVDAMMREYEAAQQEGPAT